MKKIVFYTLTLSGGGAERVICNLANSLCKDHEVTIFNFIGADCDYPVDKKIRIYHCSEKHRNTKLFKKYKAYRKLIKKIREIKPDTIISFCPTMCFIACFSRLFSKATKRAKLIISERNDPNNEYTNFILKWVANYLYSKADLVVFQTNDALKFFSKKVQKRGVIIPNPINEAFLNSENRNIIKEKSIVNVGRLCEQKNQEILIRAFAKVSPEHEDWTLKIYGSGELQQQLEELCTALGIREKVHFMGKSSSLPIELPKNEIFVLSSNYEGMPNSLMEAMACGLACIATDCPCGGPRELVLDNVDGRLVPMGDMKKLCRAIEELIDNASKRKELGNAASQKILRHYSTEKIIKTWKHIL